MSTPCGGCGGCKLAICPYCGNDQVDRDTLVCCGEPHGILTADYEDNDCPCRRACDDEGHLCEVHQNEKHVKMRAYFGLTHGMSRQERRDQLEAMRPMSDSGLAETMAEARKLK